MQTVPLETGWGSFDGMWRMYLCDYDMPIMRSTLCKRVVPRSAPMQNEIFLFHLTNTRGRNQPRTFPLSLTHYDEFLKCRFSSLFESTCALLCMLSVSMCVRGGQFSMNVSPDMPTHSGCFEKQTFTYLW
jgi:hypothetical protein